MASGGAIDVWMQQPNASFLGSPIFESLARWGRLNTDNGNPLLQPEVTLAGMEAAGVRKGLLSAWYGPLGPMITNDEVHQLCKRYPEKFAGLCSADVRDPVKAVKEIRDCVLNKGFVGVRIVPWLWERYPTDALFYPIYAECAQLGVPLCLQVGQTGPMRPSDMGRPIPYLERVALDFPELTLVGGHIGTPWTHEMIFLCTKFKNVYIDTSAYKPSRYPPELVKFMRTNGSKKVMFGTNYPMISHHDVLSQVEGLGLSKETADLFLFGNAERVFTSLHRTASKI